MRSLWVALGWSILMLGAAQTGVGVSPPRAVYTAQAGGTVQGVVVVDHPGSSGPMRVTASLSDVLVQPDGEPVYLDPGSQPRSAATWLSYTPVEFVLEPKATRAVSYTLHVPEDAADGTYWAVLFFDSGPVQEPKGGGIGVRMRVRVGHVVYVNVGRITRQGRIEGVRYRPPGGRNPPQLRIKFHNTGNGLMRLNGRVELRDAEGRVVATGTVQNAAALPGPPYEIAAPLEKAPPPGRYVALVRLDYGEPEVIVAEGEVEVP